MPDSPSSSTADVEDPLSENEEKKENQSVERNNESNELKKELAALNDQLLRALAETENLRRRAEKEREETAKYAVTNFAKSLIDVLENLYRATDVVKNNLDAHPLLKSFFEGVEMTKKELINAFEKHGIQRIYPEVGSTFDHHLHQAVVQIAETSHPTGSIVQVMQAGYLLKMGAYSAPRWWQFQHCLPEKTVRDSRPNNRTGKMLWVADR